MKFIKLTSKDGILIYIVPEHIVVIYAGILEKITKIVVTSGRDPILVVESPEYIMGKMNEDISDIDTSEETVTITKKEYQDLVKDSSWLQCLEDSGVDNWSGIEEAIRMRNE